VPNPHIEFVIDLDLIETQAASHGTAGAVYYSLGSCWWSHQRGHALATGAAMRCPVGGQIVMEKDWRGWLEAARENPGYYGKHGLRALLAAHHANVRDSQSGGFYAARNWGPYNAAIDAMLQEETGLRKRPMLRV
jgi:hypothetical protein